MLSLVHGSWYFMPVIDLYVLFVLSLYIGYGGMQCYLHTSPLLCTTLISHSLYLFSVKLIFEFLLMLDLFLSYPCVLSLYIAYGVTHVCRVIRTPPSYYAQLPPLIELSS